MTEEKKDMSCSCMMCQMCHGGKHHHHAARLIVKIIVLAIVFMAGVMIGTVHGELHSWDRGYGYGMMRGGYYGGTGRYYSPDQGTPPAQSPQGSAGASTQNVPANSPNQ